MDKYSLPAGKIDSQWKATVWTQSLSPVASESLEGLGGGREVPEGEDMCVLATDSCYCMAEVNTIL